MNHKSSRQWMRRWVGLALCAAGILLLLVSGGTLLAQSSQEAYAGRGACHSCHRDVERRFSAAAHGQSARPAEETAALAAINAAAAPFDLESVTRVIGTGRHVQRFLAAEGEAFRVLPWEWRAADGSWQPYNGPDDWAADCASCHTTAFDERSGTWEEWGVQCEACHGPGGAHSAVSGDSIRALPDDAQLSQVSGETCARCHRPLQADSEDAAFTQDWQAVHPWATGHAALPDAALAARMAATHPRQWLGEALLAAGESKYPGDSCLECHDAGVNWMAELVAVESDAAAAVDLSCLSCHRPHTSAHPPPEQP